MNRTTACNHEYYDSCQFCVSTIQPREEKACEKDGCEFPKVERGEIPVTPFGTIKVCIKHMRGDLTTPTPPVEEKKCEHEWYFDTCKMCGLKEKASTIGFSPTHPQPQPPQEWEIEFEKRFGYDKPRSYFTMQERGIEVKDFIRSFLALSKQETLAEVREKENDALMELTSTLHKQCIETDLMTLEQWNEEIAPKLSALSMAIDGVSITARTYKIHPSLLKARKG